MSAGRKCLSLNIELSPGGRVGQTEVQFEEKLTRVLRPARDPRVDRRQREFYALRETPGSTGANAFVASQHIDTFAYPN